MRNRHTILLHKASALQRPCCSYQHRNLKLGQAPHCIPPNGSWRKQASTKSPGISEASNSQKDDAIGPKPLNRPLGLPYPPQVGQNTGVDSRTLRQRKAEFMNHEKHMERRIQLVKEFSKPYFREWTGLRYQEGKTFLSNQRIFKSDKALFFPNLFGRTLDRLNPLQHTTPVFRGKISIVSVFSSLWAEQQAASFVGIKQNPTLHQILQGSNELVQQVQINVEDNWLKALLIRSFTSRLRKKLPEAQHGKYFLVTKGFTDQLKEQIGIINGKVGYVYLLDEVCRIRWAGNSVATPPEMESLNNGLRRLVEEKRRNMSIGQ
ncbi:mitochondrial ATPase complex subunit ATP10 [Coccidioides immitis H538.4]|uniref:Mitochondrial ATPase complex subunit ATP10 n=1 Tax=Coccidioides immitis H538.4 TaxID=396776 RepID=A0A0J8RTP8_COCIT|nr:mitochondrial ATPase complex subunit ATP10 [Coccidioides immitis H538.4]TPX20472.1 Mitochondrial ATPase complex subunit atp10 [Coccidioides immitis]